MEPKIIQLTPERKMIINENLRFQISTKNNNVEIVFEDDKFYFELDDFEHYVNSLDMKKIQKKLYFYTMLYIIKKRMNEYLRSL